MVGVVPEPYKKRIQESFQILEVAGAEAVELLIVHHVVEMHHPVTIPCDPAHKIGLFAGEYSLGKKLLADILVFGCGNDESFCQDMPPQIEQGLDAPAQIRFRSCRVPRVLNELVGNARIERIMPRIQDARSLTMPALIRPGVLVRPPPGSFGLFPFERAAGHPPDEARRARIRPAGPGRLCRGTHRV